MDNLDRGVDGCKSSIIDLRGAGNGLGKDIVNLRGVVDSLGKGIVNLRWVVNDWSRGINLRGVVDGLGKGIINLRGGFNDRSRSGRVNVLCRDSYLSVADRRLPSENGNLTEICPPDSLIIINI